MLKSITLVTGNKVGQHFIVPGSLISNNFNIRYGLGILTINPAIAKVTISPGDLTKTYDGLASVPNVSTEPANLNVDITFDGSDTPPVNVGSYLVKATVNDLNYIGSSSATLHIEPVNAYVIADDAYIFENDPLPEFTATFNGFINNDDESVVNELSFNINPTYKGAAGTYQVIPYASAENYFFNPVNGTLYVNPFGPGTKNVKTSLTCVEPIPMDADGYTYIANFAWENPNNATVYIPIGPDNQITGTGLFESNRQPVAFPPGNGTWQARFDGNSITWEVTSYNGTHKTSTASDASSTSNKCDSNKGKNGLKSVTTDAAILSLSDSNTFNVYPNPTNDKVNITVGNAVVNQENVLIYDLAGRIVNVNMERPSEGNVQFDFTGLENGIYFIRFNLNTVEKTIKIIKQ